MIYNTLYHMFYVVWVVYEWIAFTNRGPWKREQHISYMYIVAALSAKTLKSRPSATDFYCYSSFLPVIRVQMNYTCTCITRAAWL